MACHTSLSDVRPSLALSPQLAHAHSQAGVLIVSFTDGRGSPTAVNWARSLSSLSLTALIGLTGPIGPRELSDLRSTGVGLFCADGKMAQLDSPSGRWEQLARLLFFGLDVLCSDADIAWLRSPLPYLARVKRAHPLLDVALTSDRVTLDFSATPLPARSLDLSSRQHDLELEDALTFKTPSYNVGVVMLYSGSSPGSARTMASMLRAWSRACILSAPTAKLRVHSWAQGPINTKVLTPEIRRHPSDAVRAAPELPTSPLTRRAAPPLSCYASLHFKSLPIIQCPDSSL